MADWFKFYENGIYESRFQWAIHEESGVCPVWLWILSECCKHKSDNFGWEGKDIELFGVSHVTNVTAPKVNCSINLLIQIGYINIDGAHIKVLQWNKFQSDYMRKKENRESGHSPDTVRTKTEKVVLEERRVEEKDNTVPMLVIEYLNSKSGSNFRMAKSNLDFIGARINEGATLDDMKMVIDLKCKDWLGKPEAKYLRPETLFNATKYNSYIGLASATKPKTYIPQTSSHLREAERLAAIARARQAGDIK